MESEGELRAKRLKWMETISPDLRLAIRRAPEDTPMFSAPLPAGPRKRQHTIGRMFREMPRCMWTYYEEGQ